MGDIDPIRALLWIVVLVVVVLVLFKLFDALDAEAATGYVAARLGLI